MDTEPTDSFILRNGCNHMRKWDIARHKLKSFFKRLKTKITLTNTIIFIGILTTIIYLFSFLFPFTDNAFIVNNVRPVAALASGYITDLYVHNGQRVIKGQKLFTIFKKPYLYTLEQTSADLGEAKAQLAALKTTYERDLKLSDTENRLYVKLQQDDQKYQKAYKIKIGLFNYDAKFTAGNARCSR